MPDLWIPSPVGGIPLPLDFGPSIFFATLHGLTIVAFIYRFREKRMRTSLLIGTIGFAVERSIIFCLRAVESHDLSSRGSKSVTDYMQCTIGMGYLAMGSDLLSLLRCLLVNSTKGPESSDNEVPLTGLSTTIFSIPESPPQDKPRERRVYRRLTDFVFLLYVASMVTGGIGNATIGSGVEDKGKARTTIRLRWYASSALALVIMIFVGWMALWARFKRPRVPHTPAMFLVALSFLLAIVPTYRLAVMYNKTPAFANTDPGSLNTPMEKTGFYVFHIVPEWILVTILCGGKTREIFNTGPRGDDKWWDETPRQKGKRERKEREKREKAEKAEKPQKKKEAV